MPEVPDHLQEPLAEVQRAYPHGVQGSERAALLVALADELSERNVGDLMWAWLDEEPVVAQGDLTEALSVRRPPPEQVEQARQRLRDAR